MKKILIFILLVFGGLMITNHVNAAEDVTVNESDAFYTWSLINSNGVYMLKSDRVENLTSFMDITVYTHKDFSYDVTSPDEEEIFVYQNGVETSRLTTYATDTSVSLLQNYQLSYIEPGFTDILMLNYSYPTHGASLGDVYYEITLVLSSSLTSEQRSFLLAVANNDQVFLENVRSTYSHYGFEGTIDDLDFRFLDAYFDQTQTVVDPGDLTTLPQTNGSIYDDINDMGDVTILNIDGYTVDLRITYNTLAYDLSYTFSANTDMTIFDDAYEIFYYTYEDQHFIVFNQGASSMFYQTQIRTETFIPYTTWNLDTNELASIERFNVYMYMKIGDGEHLFGYFYVDEFVIENLLQVHASFQYRFMPTIWGDASEWYDFETILENGAYQPGNVSWKWQGLTTSLAALNLFSNNPLIAMPLALVGTYFAYESVDTLLDGNRLWIDDTEQIELVNPSLSLQNEVNTAYLSAYDQFDGLDLSSYNLWKLDFGAFEKTFNELQIDPESVNVISFTYMTSGQVYTIDEENINTVVNVSDNLLPVEHTSWITNFIDWLKGKFGDALPGIALVVAIVLVVILRKPIRSLLRTIERIIKNPKRLLSALFIIGGLVLAGIYLMSVI